MSLLLGVVDQAITLSDSVTWSDNKIGGKPIWMSNSKSSCVQKCPGCTMDMTLVVQLYCPLSNSAYHRCLYVFVCASAECPQYNSWKVYRNILYDETYAPIKAKKETASKQFDNDMWTNDQDDWGDDDDLGTAASSDDWGIDKYESHNAIHTNGEDGALFHQNSKVIPILKSNEGISSSQCSHSQKTENNLTEIVERAKDNSEAHDPKAVPKEISADFSSHSTTDEDLSACFSSIEVGENQDHGEAGGDALMEDLNVPDTSRLDQLASVLNTKYKDSTITHHPSSRQPILLKPYYLSVVEGTSHQSLSAMEDGHIANLIREYEEVEGKQIKEIIRERSATKGKGGSETYEKSNVKHGDKVFHKFWKEIQKFSEQCIRYERCGHPLLVKGLSPVQSVIPPCPKCGSPRVFELQLVPALIPWLCSQEGKPSNIEFGAVLVYTCEKSCSPSNNGNFDLFEEHVIFQHDPDHHLYR